MKKLDFTLLTEAEAARIKGGVGPVVEGSPMNVETVVADSAATVAVDSCAAD
jgi:hypothetical protein